MRLPSWRLIYLWQRNRDVFFRLWRTEAPGAIAEPLILLLAFGAGLGGYIGLLDGQRYIEFLAPGIIAAYAMFSANFECTYGSYLRMEYQYTYDAILATPLSVEDIIAGEIFWGATRALLTGTIILIIAAAFRLVPSPWALLVLPVVFLEGVMFAALALFVTSIVPAIYSFNYYFTLFISPMFLLSGVFFPLAGFPEILQRLSWLAPLTPAVYLARALVQGTFGREMWLALGIVAAYAAVFCIITMFSMSKRLTR